MERIRKLAAVVLLVAGSLLVQGTVSYAFCDTGATGGGGSFGGGYQNYGVACCLQAVAGYIKGGKYDPPYTGHSAWVMLTSWSGGNGFAQAGWKYNQFETTYYIFAGWKPSGGLYDEFLWRAHSVPQFSHSYEVHAIGTSPGLYFDNWYDGAPFWPTPANMGFTPNEIQIFSESHERAAHWPGSIGYEIEHWGLAGKDNGTWASTNLTSNISGYTDVVGLNFVAGNDFYSWDKRCTDAPSG